MKTHKPKSSWRHHVLTNYVHRLATSKKTARLHTAAYAAYYCVAGFEEKGIRLVAIAALIVILILHHVDTELG